MDDAPNPPLVFANRVIRQYADHLLGEDMIMLPQDFTVLRTVFRSCKGSWERVVHGDIVHNRLLSTLITTWGGMPGRKRRTEMG